MSSDYPLGKAEHRINQQHDSIVTTFGLSIQLHLALTCITWQTWRLNVLFTGVFSSFWQIRRAETKIQVPQICSRKITSFQVGNMGLYSTFCWINSELNATHPRGSQTDYRRSVTGSTMKPSFNQGRSMCETNLPIEITGYHLTTMRLFLSQRINRRSICEHIPVIDHCFPSVSVDRVFKDFFLQAYTCPDNCSFIWNVNGRSKYPRRLL